MSKKKEIKAPVKEAKKEINIVKMSKGDRVADVHKDEVAHYEAAGFTKVN